MTTNESWNGQDVVREWHTCKEEEWMWARERAQWLRVSAILAGDCILFPEPMWYGSYLSITPGSGGPIPLFGYGEPCTRGCIHRVSVYINIHNIHKSEPFENN